MRALICLMGDSDLFYDIFLMAESRDYSILTRLLILSNKESLTESVSMCLD